MYISLCVCIYIYIALLFLFQPWREFLTAVNERLCNAGFANPNEESVVSLRSGALVVASTRDLRPGELLDALLVKSAAAPRFITIILIY